MAHIYYSTDFYLRATSLSFQSDSNDSEILFVISQEIKIQTSRLFSREFSVKLKLQTKALPLSRMMTFAWRGFFIR